MNGIEEEMRRRGEEERIAIGGVTMVVREVRGLEQMDAVVRG